MGVLRDCRRLWSPDAMGGSVLGRKNHAEPKSAERRACLRSARRMFPTAGPPKRGAAEAERDPLAYVASQYIVEHLKSRGVLSGWCLRRAASPPADGTDSEEARREQEKRTGLRNLVADVARPG